VRGVAELVRIVALLLLAAGTVYAFQRCVLEPLRCSHAASVGAATLEQMDPADFRIRALARHIHADLEDCRCVSPPDVAIAMTRAAALEANGDRAAAIAEYERALLIDRRPEIYFQLGLLQHNAIGSFVRACAFDPARLREIPSEDVRRETERRLSAMYGSGWVR